MLNFSYISSTSLADSFKNYDSDSFSSSIAGQTLTAGTFVSTTATMPLSNTNSICQVQTQYSGLETFYRVINGQAVGNYGGGSYQIQTFYYFTSTTLTVMTIVVNQTGGNVTIPAITINCRATLFQAPF